MQLESESGKIITMYSSTYTDKQVYQDARNYLLTQEHRRDELETKLEDDYIIDEKIRLQRKIESIDTRCFLKDNFGRTVEKYTIDRWGTVYKNPDWDSDD